MDQALVQLLREIGEALVRYADAAEREPGPVTALKWRDRVERQQRILQEIVDAGGSVDKKTWHEIAARHGYVGRGVSGFFRAGDTGLLALDGDVVSVTDKGLQRLAEGA